MRTPAFAAVLAVVWLAPAVRAEDCVVLGAPTNLSGVIEDYTGASGPYRTLHLTWKNPALTFAESQQVALRHRVERRDVTSSPSAAWSLLQKSPDDMGYFSDGGTFNGIKGATDPPTLCFTPCAEPGRTYEYRVILEYAYEPGCTQYDAGKYTNATPASNVFRITFPGPPPKAPENVRAVAHPKKKQVTVAWDADEGDRFRVERRRVPPGPAAKAAEDFALVAETTGPVRTITDKTVDPGEVFEYRVSAVSGETVVAGPTDAAYPAGACPKPRFDLWSDEALLMTDHPIRLLFDDSGPTDQPLVAEIRYERETPPGEEPVLPVWLLDETPGKDSVGDSAIAFQGVLKTPFNQFASVPAGSKLSLVVALGADDPFDSKAWLEGDVRIRSGHLSLTGRAAYEEGTRLSTRICGSLAAGKLKKETVPVGQVVAFLFRMVALGPSPLLAGRVKLTADVEGGKLAGGRIVSRIEQILFAVGTDHAELAVGALGPETPTRSEEAAILFLVVADTYPASGQLRLRVGVEATQGKLGDQPDQTIALERSEYVAEVLVARPKPPK